MSEDTRLWFVYGSLKPGELGYRRIESRIAETFPRQLDGWRLALRDGLPVVTRRPYSTVDGFVLEAKPDQLDALDLSIRSFEDPNTYAESIATVKTPDNEHLQVRVNAAKHPNKSPLEPVSSGACSFATHYRSCTNRLTGPRGFTRIVMNQRFGKVICRSWVRCSTFGRSLNAMSRSLSPLSKTNRPMTRATRPVSRWPITTWRYMIQILDRNSSNTSKYSLRNAFTVLTA